jgi:predicted outer membrane repeat protein
MIILTGVENKMNKRKLLIIFLIATLTISMISAVSAVDLTIGPDTEGGLREAIKNAQNGDTIYLKEGVYSGYDNIAIKISKDIKIKGLSSKVVLDGKGTNKILSISVKKVFIEQIKFTNGKDSNGGAIYVDSQGSLDVKKCVFTNNKAGSWGGAICSFGTSTISGSTFTNNNAGSWGGAIFIGSYSGERKLIVNNCEFNNNKANQGGAIDFNSRSSGKITNSKFTKNNAQNYGGAIDIVKSAKKVTVSKCTFTDNKAKKRGGAINVESSASVVDSKFNKNIVGSKYNAITTYANGKVSKKNVKITPKDGTKV